MKKVITKVIKCDNCGRSVEHEFRDKKDSIKGASYEDKRIDFCDILCLENMITKLRDGD